MQRYTIKAGIMASEAEKLRKLILKKTAEFQRARAKTVVEFDRNTPRGEVSGRVFDEHDVAALVDASLEFWLTAGRFADRFESELADLFGLRHAMMVNSGSSANLVALSALTSRFLGERRLR